MYVIIKEDEKGKQSIVFNYMRFQTEVKAIRFLGKTLQMVKQRDKTAKLTLKRKLEDKITYDYVELKYRTNPNNPTLLQEVKKANYYITLFNSISLKGCI